MHNTLRFLLASLLVPAVVLLGESASLAQYPPAAPPPGYGPPPGQPMPVYSPTPYQPAYQPVAYPGYHEHDGFFLRLGIGGGYLSTSVSGGGSSATLSGGAFSFSAAFGGSVAPNLVVFGEFGAMSVTDPEWSSGGTSSTLDGVTLNMISFGPGVAYYIQPINMYVSGTINFTKFTMNDSETDDKLADSKMGFGFSAMLGKEWWISSDWGIGVAGQFQLGTAKDKNGSDRLTGTGFALMFSATYN
jgi:hypothetical protein